MPRAICLRQHDKLGVPFLSPASPQAVWVPEEAERLPTKSATLYSGKSLWLLGQSWLAYSFPGMGAVWLRHRVGDGVYPA